MSNNQLYPYEALNNNNNNDYEYNNNNNNFNYLKNQLNLTQDGNYIVRHTYTYQRNVSSTYDNTTQNNKVKKYNNKNKKQNKTNQHNTNQHNTNQHNTNQHNTNNSNIKRKPKTKMKNKPQNNHKVDIKSPKNNNCNYIITNTKPNTEIVSIHKDIYNEYHEDIHKLFGRVEFHMKNDNFNSFSSYWTEILNKFNYIYNIYNGNKGIVGQYSMEKVFKELHDKMTLLTKK